MLRQPDATAAAISEFGGADVGPVTVRERGRRLAGRPPAPGGWRRVLTARQLADVEQVAGTDLRRVGYGS